MKVTVMRFNNKTGSNRGYYLDHLDEKLVVEMEASIVAKMFIDKQRGFDTWGNYLLVFKRDNDADWWEIPKGVKLEIFCSENFTFGFIKLTG